jgi:hypothetical protein
MKVKIADDKVTGIEVDGKVVVLPVSRKLVEQSKDGLLMYLPFGRQLRLGKNVDLFKQTLINTIKTDDNEISVLWLKGGRLKIKISPLPKSSGSI